MPTIPLLSQRQNGMTARPSMLPQRTISTPLSDKSGEFLFATSSTRKATEITIRLNMRGGRVRVHNITRSARNSSSNIQQYGRQRNGQRCPEGQTELKPKPN